VVRDILIPTPFDAGAQAVYSLKFAPCDAKIMQANQYTNITFEFSTPYQYRMRGLHS